MRSYNLNNIKIKELGIFLRESRQNKNINVSELSEKLGVNAGYISKLENGSNSKSINILLLKAICETLELDYIELLKNIGYLDKESLIFNIEEIGKMTDLFKELGNELGVENGLYQKFTNFFVSVFNKCNEDNLKVYENIEEIKKEQNHSEFIIKSCRFKQKNLKLFFKKVDVITDAEEGKYILINYKGETLLKKIYIQNSNVILISSNKNVKPFIGQAEEMQVLGVLYKTEEIIKY